MFRYDQVMQRQSFRDPRVKVAVAINPVTNPIFSASSMQALAVPILVVSGTHDIFAPSLSQQLVPFSWIQQQGSLLVLQNNGTHLSFLEGTSDLPLLFSAPICRSPGRSSRGWRVASLTTTCARSR